MKTIGLILLVVLVFSCKPEPVFQPHDNLLDFQIRTVYGMEKLFEMSESEHRLLNSDEFNPTTDTLRFTDSIIYVSFLKEVNSCSTYDGNITMINDSIQLSLTNISGLSCSSLGVARITYKISNPENVMYAINKDINFEYLKD